MPEGCTSKTVIDDIHTDVGTVAADVAATHVHADAAVTAILNVSSMSNSEAYSFGLASGLMSEGSTTPIVVTGGNAAFGTQVLLYKGGGLPDSKNYAHFRGLNVTAVTAANKNSLLKFFLGSLGSAVAYTMEADDEIVTAAGHGLADGNMVIFDTMSPDETHGVTKSIVYFVRDMSGSTFKVALTSGGAAVTIDADLSGNIRKITALTGDVGELVVSRAATTCDSNLDPLVASQRAGGSDVIFAAAKSESGSTVGISFFLGASCYST